MTSNLPARDLLPEDAEAIQETCATPGHRLIQGRIRENLETMRDRLEDLTEENVTNYRRGIIEGLRIALQIPEILEDEAKNHGRPETRS